MLQIKYFFSFKRNLDTTLALKNKFFISMGLNISHNVVLWSSEDTNCQTWNLKKFVKNKTLAL